MDTPREQIREKHRESVRMAFLDAAVNLIAERGFGGTSVHDIAKATGYATGSFYQFFSSKEQMYDELVNHHCRQMVERLRKAKESEKTPPAQFRATIRAVIEYFNGNRTFFRIYFVLTPNWDSPHVSAESEAKRMLNEFLEEMRLMYEEGQRRGDFRSDVPPHLIVRFAHGAISCLLLFWSQQVGQSALPDAAEQERIVGEFILNGIRGGRA